MPTKPQKVTADQDEARRLPAALDCVATVRCFLNAIGPKAKDWLFCTYDDNPKRGGDQGEIKPFIKRGTIDDRSLREMLRSKNKVGAGVYVKLNKTPDENLKAEDVMMVRAVMLDLDGAPLEPVLQCPLVPHAIVETSPGRFHVYWRVKDFPLDKYVPVQFGLAKRCDGDPGVAKLSVLARLPGFRHMKDGEGHHTVKLVAVNDLSAYSYEQIVAEFPPEEKPHRASGSRRGNTLPKGDYIAAAEAFARHQFALETEGGAWLLSYRSEFFRWTGTHYESVGRKNLRSAIYRFLNECWTFDKKGNIEPYNPNRSRVAEVIEALEARTNEDEARDAPFWLPPLENMGADGWLACQNGLLNLETLDIIPHDPHYFNTLCLPFDYDASAPPPREWYKFLRQIWPNDKRARMTLAEIFGYMLTSDVTQQKLFMWVGPKRGGKGTAGHVLTALLGGSANVANPTLSSLSEPFGRWPLIHKRAAIVSDARLGGKANTANVVERLLNISGADNQTINRKYLSHWTGRLNTRFLVLTNELPQVLDASQALASRFIILTSNVSFLGREDTKLLDKLLLELPGILNWSLHGLKRLTERGKFRMPKSSLEAVRMLEDLSSPVAAFIRDWVDVDSGKRVNVKLLYGAWKAWCDAKGERPGSDTRFGRDLRAALPQVIARGRATQRFYQGIALNAEGFRRYDAWADKQKS